MSTAEVQSTLTNGLNNVKIVLTALVAIVGVIAVLKIVIKHLPNIDDPNEKNNMWKSIGSALVAVAAGAAIIWLVPWIYSLFA